MRSLQRLAQSLAKSGGFPSPFARAITIIAAASMTQDKGFHYEFFCKKQFPVSIADTHYLQGVVGDTEIRKGDGMQLDQLIQNTSSYRDTSARIQLFGLDVLKDAFQLGETAPVDLPDAEKGIPTISGKSKIEYKDKDKKHKKHKDKEHKKHKHCHKDRSKDKENYKDKEKDKSRHRDSSADSSKKYHEKKRKHVGDDDAKDLHKHKKTLFVFGDSLFDIGNNNYIKTTTTSHQANYPPYGQIFFSSTLVEGVQEDA